MPSGSSRSASPTNRALATTNYNGQVATNDPNVITAGKHEEWTTSKKTVNHKTRHIETRVQRQLVLEDGKVVADSGPQVSQRTKEDNKVEESEDTKHKTSGEPQLPEGYKRIPGSERVINEKTETHHRTRENREENLKMHDENFQQLDNPEDYHRKALVLPEQGDMPLVGVDPSRYPGKVTHYSNKCKRVTDKDKVKEITEEVNGRMNTQTTRTHHHEEVDDDEVPEEMANEADQNFETKHTREFEYLDDGRGRFEDLETRLRRDKQLLQLRAPSPAGERHDPVTRKALSVEEEEEIRNSETNRWLANHFGSDYSGSDDESPRKPPRAAMISATTKMHQEYHRSGTDRYSKPQIIVQSPVSTLKSTKNHHRVTEYREPSPPPIRNSWKSTPNIYQEDQDFTYHRGTEPGLYSRSKLVNENVFMKNDRRHTTLTRPEGFSSSSPKHSTLPSYHHTSSLPKENRSKTIHHTEYTRHKKSSRGVQADFDEPYDSQSLPRNTTVHHHHHHRHHRKHEENPRYIVQSPTSTLSNGSRPSRTFYFGDKNDQTATKNFKNGYYTIESLRSTPQKNQYFSNEDLRSSPRPPQDRQRHFRATPPSSPPPRLIKVHVEDRDTTTTRRVRSPSPVHAPPPSFLRPRSPPVRTASPVNQNLPTFSPLSSLTEIKRQQSFNRISSSSSPRIMSVSRDDKRPGTSVVEIRDYASR